MRIWTISDLHLEVEGLYAPLAVPDADVCVIAGDLTRPLAAGVRWIAENILPNMPVVYVPGNHEFYRSSVKEGTAEGIEEAKRHPDLHLLLDDFAVIGGVRFLGCSLWTDFRLMGQQPIAMEFARGLMNDYKTISWRKHPWERLTPRHTLEMHEKSRTFLRSAMAIPFDGPTVVVTHHCPHPGSIHDKYRGDLLNAAFCSDLTDEIEMGRPELWIHGHTHHAFDYVVGETRIVCNPRGYGTENRAGFDPSLVVDVSRRPRPAAG